MSDARRRLALVLVAIGTMACRAPAPDPLLQIS
jgi:hypothetical protein